MPLVDRTRTRPPPAPLDFLDFPRLRRILSRRSLFGCLVRLAPTPSAESYDLSALTFLAATTPLPGSADSAENLTGTWSRRREARHPIFNW